MLRVAGVSCRSEPGEFRANTEVFGWRPTPGGRRQLAWVRSLSSLRHAQWFDGEVRFLCEHDDGTGMQTLTLQGFGTSDFDPLWRHLERRCGVFLQRREARATCSEADVDTGLGAFEHLADLVDDAAGGSVQKKAREADLMHSVQTLRDVLERAVRGDRQVLSRVFSADGCERIGRLRLVIETVRLEVFGRDSRWLHLRSSCDIIEAILREMGTYRPWVPQEGGAHAARARRQHLIQLRRQLRPFPARAAAGDAEAEDQGAGEDEDAGADGGEAGEEQAPLLGARGGRGGALPAEAPAGRSAAAGEEAGASSMILTQSQTSAAAEAEATPSSMYSAFDRERKYEDSTFEGWVWKRSRYLKLWRRRYLVLRNGLVSTFKNGSCAQATEMFSAAVIGGAFAHDAGGAVQSAFCMKTGQRDYYMLCDAKADRDVWLREIMRAVRDTGKRSR